MPEFSVELLEIGNDFAERIGERNREKDQHSRLLALASKQKEALNEQKQAFNRSRLEYLKACGTRDGLEIEARELCEKKEALRAETKRVKDELALLKQKLEAKRSAWKEEGEKMTQHRYKRNFYQWCVENRIQHAEQARSKRKQKLDLLKNRILLGRLQEVRQEHEFVQSENERLEKETSQHDIDVRNLAVQVREHLAKRTSLRERVRQEQKNLGFDRDDESSDGE